VRIANGRKRKIRILFLEKDGGRIEGDKSILEQATQFYSDQFCPAPSKMFQIEGNIWFALEMFTTVNVFFTECSELWRVQDLHRASLRGTANDRVPTEIMKLLRTPARFVHIVCDNFYKTVSNFYHSLYI
jgi:hypothetical protein